MKRVGLVFALSGALVLAAAASAQAFIYWAAPGSMSEGTAIGRANNDGSGVDNQFISTGAVPSAVAVNSAHIYWANNDDNSIGRANLDGSGVDNSFITGITQPTGVAVTSQYVFWSSLGNAIGRANLG